MNPKNLDPFQFSNRLDNKFLDEFFENDTAYACSVFEEFLTTISQFWNEVEQAWHSGEPATLKAAIHKSKTLFGYVGHKCISGTLDRFEDLCLRASGMSELAYDYEKLVYEKNAATLLIGEELQRLLQHHRQRTA